MFLIVVWFVELFETSSPYFMVKIITIFSWKLLTRRSLPSKKKKKNWTISLTCFFFKKYLNNVQLRVCVKFDLGNTYSLPIRWYLLKQFRLTGIVTACLLFSFKFFCLDVDKSLSIFWTLPLLIIYYPLVAIKQVILARIFLELFGLQYLWKYWKFNV